VTSILIFAVVVLSAIGIASAVILYFVAQKFKVLEDPNIGFVEVALPGTNCGGCGYPGCRNFAEALVHADKMDEFFCPVGGNEIMKRIGEILGYEVGEVALKVAVIRCNGSFENALHKVYFDGAALCSFAHTLYAGESGCPFSCLGLGDCVRSCQFDAMFMNPDTGLPVIIEDKCVACGVCVKVCPRAIIELRNKGPRNRRIFVCCINEESGDVAGSNCKVACIACRACLDACKFDAITFENNLAYIDYSKCTLCRKCPPLCPTFAIHEVNLPTGKEKVSGRQKVTDIINI
jgi:Na+-translocating ferredoxin:NAD+ oxidoreductase RNF subunit RnfB